jgi:hypothetical protein
MGSYEEEHEKTRNATSISRKRGGAEIAIDFENQIFGFPAYSISRFDVVSYIFESEDYDIISLGKPIGSINSLTGRLEKGSNFFSTDEIFVRFAKEGWKEILLDDYAYDFFTKQQQNISIFESSDFLDQVCITHSIRRVWHTISSIDPWNEYRKMKREKVHMLMGAILQVLEPKIAQITNSLYSGWKGAIDRGDIESATRVFANILAFGENKKVIQDVLTKMGSGEKRSALRGVNRAYKVHPFATFSKKKVKNTDIEGTETITRCLIGELLLSSAKTGNKQLFEILFQLRTDPDAYTSLVVDSISGNSERIFTPNTQHTLVDHIFGNRKRKERSRIKEYVQNLFRTQISSNKNRGDFDADVEMNHFDDSSYEDVMGYGRSNSAVNIKYGRKKWRWQKNKLSKHYSQEQLEEIGVSAKAHLKGRCLDVFLKFLSEGYVTTGADRAALSRAKQKLREHGLDLP